MLLKSMPFPLAHPAAVLPLRRFCPRYLSFPALIIGSLCPDVGYAGGRLNLEEFAHRPLVGTFGFCLPVGLVLMLGFYLVRLPLVRLLPARQRQVFLPLCRQPAAPPFQIAVSLLLGALTHQYWMPRPIRNTGWCATRPRCSRRCWWWGRTGCCCVNCFMPAARFSAWPGWHWFICAGGSGTPPPACREAMQWFCALLLASAFLWLALDARGQQHHIRIHFRCDLFRAVGGRISPGNQLALPPASQPRPEAFTTDPIQSENGFRQSLPHGSC